MAIRSLHIFFQNQIADKTHMKIKMHKNSADQITERELKLKFKKRKNTQNLKHI